ADSRLAEDDRRLYDTGVVSSPAREAAMPRFSILGMMGSILALAVGLAALRNADELWAGVMLLLAFGLLGIALLHIIYRPGQERAWWLGFALLGGGYLVLAIGPWFSEEVQPKLATTRLLEHVHRRIVPSPNLRKLQSLQASRVRLISKLSNITRLVRNSTSDPAVVGARQQ